jgi:CheY-like chemotaxis protein
MSDKPTLLVVDDSPSEIRILMELLKDSYAVLAATTGERAIEIVDESSPELVLMDVTMEPMDGYEACHRIKQAHGNLPVIFVSANTETQEIMKGFEAGGQDYITKPIEPEILKTKVKVTLEQAAQQKKLATEKQEVSDLVMAAISSAGDLSIILNFLRKSTKLNTSDELAQGIVEACTEYGLQSTASIIGLNKTSLISSIGQVPPLEVEILHRATQMDDRILEQGNRMILNFESVSLLVKNMPVTDDARCGELRDYLMILVENANDLNQKIKSDNSIAEQRMAMVLEAVRESQSTLASIQAFQQKYKEDSMRILDQLLVEVESEFYSMGLTEAQEQTITSIIQTKLNEGIEHMESGLQMDEQLKRLTEHLGDLTKSM